MAKWRYFNPDHWNFLFPPLSHKELRVIEEFLSGHEPVAKLLQRALQGVFPKSTFIEIHLYKDRPSPESLGVSIRSAKDGEKVKTLKEERSLSSPCLGIIFKWVYSYDVETTFVTDARFLLKNSVDITQGYQVYEHLLQDDNGQWHCYWGITKRTWKRRWDEHVAAALRGSDYLFHKAIRELMPKNLSEVHQVAAVGFTEKEEMDHEEWFVEHFSLYPDNPHGMNMVPGGYAGIRALHKLRILTENHHINPEDRDVIIEQYLRSHPRKGVANPLIAAKWADEAYATAIICGSEGRLNPEQVRKIRQLSSLGWDANSIKSVVEAKDVHQVKRVIRGKTYARIH